MAGEGEGGKKFENEDISLLWSLYSAPPILIWHQTSGICQLLQPSPTLSLTASFNTAEAWKL